MECLKEASQIGMRVMQISCGENHSLALIEMPSEEGEGQKCTKLFVWGSNDKW